VFDIGAGELIGLLVIALLIFGPDRLPGFASDAARFVRKIRAFSSDASRELRENLGPELTSLSASDLNPKKAIRSHLLDDIDGSLDVDQAKSAPPRVDPDAT
jgi:sec-independent protein translocase protein TatB